jgi:hypothetical protein
MLLLGSRSKTIGEANAWSARTHVCAGADQVLDALTDPELIAGWAPVSFDVDGLAGGRLTPGSRERVSGTIAGVTATFEVEVLIADRQRLELVARGPVSFEVLYVLREQGGQVIVDARVSLRPQRGLAAHLLRAATSALLDAGALGRALRRLEQSLCRDLEAGLIAA